MNMYVIPGTHGLYGINEDLEVKKLRGIKAGSFLPKRKHYILDLYFKRYRILDRWLYWYARYNLEFIKPYTDCVKLLKFVRKNPKYDNHAVNSEPVAVYFREPIYVDANKEFRLLPRYPKYAISKDGRLLNLVKNTIKTPNMPKDNNQYPTHNINGKTLRAHILVAMAWVENDDKANKIIVDHIDGNKTNYHADNLRWVSFKQNNLFKYDQGLSGQSIAVKVRNIETGEVSEYPSIRRACEAIKRSAIDTLADPLEKGKVWITETGKYEILPVEGFDGWAYEDKQPEVGRNQKVKITITHPDGRVDVITSLEDFTNKIFNGKKSADRIEKAIEVTKRLHPEAKITVERLDVKNSYIALNLKTGKEYIRETYLELSKLSKVPKSSVGKSVRSNGVYSYNGWVFKKNDGYDWPDEFKTVQKTRVEVTDVKENVVKVFDSLRSAAKYIGVDKNTVKVANDYLTKLKDRYTVRIVA